MSNDRPHNSKRKPKFAIESVKISDQDTASVRRVLGRLTGRVPFPVEELDPLSTTNFTGSTSLPSSTNNTGATNSDGTTNHNGATTNTVGAESIGSTSKSSSTIDSGTTTGSGTTARQKRVIPKASQIGIAPERDFQRVPNSVTREAMAAGLFRGKSKQVWDYLWSISRGAVIPSRTVRCSRPKIKTGAGLGSMNTVDSSIEHLKSVGLLQAKKIVGEEGGNLYEIFTPEEVAARLFGTPISSGATSTDGSTGTTQKEVVPVLPNYGSTGTTSTPTDTTVSGESKTFLKTERKNLDDDPFAGLSATLAKAATGLTGKTPHASERDRWSELGEVLATELKIAAARTSNISSVPAFLTEHLRRRLNKAPASTTAASSSRTEPVSERAAPVPPTPEELIDTYVNFRHSGMSSDEIDALLSPSVDPEQWSQIRQAAIERYEAERGAVRPPQMPVG